MVFRLLEQVRVLFRGASRQGTRSGLSGGASLPRHLAIIMDGNGRWATNRGLPREAGHRAGVESLREVVHACAELGIPYLTVYAFSTENWKRPRSEVETLMRLLVEYVRREMEQLHRHGVRVHILGRTTDLPLDVQVELDKAVHLTMHNNRITLNIALNYGGRAELVDAVRGIASKVKNHLLQPEEINAETIATHLYTAGQPDPDLLIRPAGELRISNFLLWQLAYTEFWLTDVLWPDFRREHLMDALRDYQNRERRFGALK